MQVEFTITAAEWREARYLHRTRGQRGVGETWAWLLVAVPVIGSIGDVVHNFRASGMTLRDSIVPLLLLLAAATMAGLILTSRMRERRAGRAAGMTEVEWKLNIGESGWQRSRPDDPDSLTIEYAWDEFSEYRVGRHVLMLALNDGVRFETLPFRTLEFEEIDRLKRMIARKIKAARPVEESRTGRPAKRTTTAVETSVADAEESSQTET